MPTEGSNARWRGRYEQEGIYYFFFGAAPVNVRHPADRFASEPDVRTSANI
jgi:hypothetical protein